MKFIIQYKNQYIKVEANEKYFHIDKSYRFTSIKKWYYWLSNPLLSDMWRKT